MLHTLRFSLQNAVYFIMLPFLVPLLFTFYIQVCKYLNVKLQCQKVNFIYLYFDIGVQSDVYLLGPILIKENSF